MSSLVRGNIILLFTKPNKWLITSVLCCFSVFMSAQNPSRGYYLPSELKKLNRKQTVLVDTSFYENGNILSIGKQKLFYSYQGCLGLWPVYRSKGKWTYYYPNGKVQAYYWYGKNKIRCSKKFELE